MMLFHLIIEYCALEKVTTEGKIGKESQNKVKRTR